LIEIVNRYSQIEYG